MSCGQILLIGVLALYLLRFARSWRWVAVALLVCVLDQAAKAVISPNGGQHRVSLLGGWLRIAYTENWEQGFGANVPYLLATTVLCVAALYLLYERLLKARYRMSPLAEVAVALMVGGYMGILLDRVRLGFVVDFLEFGELMCHDALYREESCGGHFREEYQTEEGEAKRNDEEFAHVAAWEFTGVGSPPTLHKEPLEFEVVQLGTRSYK